MSQLLLLNPRRKTRRRMPAGLRKFWASRRRASNPRRRRRHTARASNPRRRHRRHAMFRSNPRRRSRRSRMRRYSNPRRRSGGGFTPGRGSVVSNYIIPAALGGVGAIAFDILWAYGQQYLPASLQSGWVGTGVELAAIWLLLVGVRRYAPRSYRTVSAAATGAATVLAYNALKGVAQQVLPASIPGLSGYMSFPMGRLGAYQVRRLGDLYSPAAVVQAPVRQFGAYQAHTGGGNGTIDTPGFGGDGM